MRYVRIIIVSLMLLTTQLLAGCEEQEAGVTTKLEQRGELMYQPGAREPYTGKYHEFYENGQMKSEIMYFQGQKYGIMTLWHSDGTKAYEGEFRADKRFGTHMEWFKDSTKKSQTRYDNDHKHGVEIIWYPNGNKMSEIEYKFDQKDGRAQGWFQDGKPIYDNHYRRGIQRLE
ncbi:MAG: hypothetical protein D8M28_09075 [Proteobacteria bacterium]|nr:hypothetical protein [Pseudomonadota bacterium]